MFHKRDKDVLQRLVARECEEEHLVTAYRQVADAIPDSAVRLFLRLILEDEERHYRLLQIVSSEKGPTPDTAAEKRRERMDFPEDPELLESTKEFLSMEKNGLRELRRLRARATPGQSESLSIILDLMVADTRKHVTLLQHMKERLERSSRPDIDWDSLASVDRYGQPGVPAEQVIREHTFRSAIGLIGL